VCEYCGCQEVDVIAQLTAEHDRLRSLGRDLAEAADRGDLAGARPIAHEMRHVLAPHTRVEEAGLFPELAAEFGDQLADLEREHVVIDGALEDLDRDAPVVDWPQRTHAALALLFDHILKEQDGVFPAALANLSPDGWDRVGKVREDAAAASPH
jgi:hemerythrin-like domain-containing protein